MRYNKPALTYEQQADQLLARGLIADRVTLIERLQSVNYYRLSGYWYPFRKDDSTFQQGTTFETVWRRYTFDRRLRLIVLDAIERTEIAIRTEVTYRMAHAHGPFGYLNTANMPNLEGADHLRLISQLRDTYARSRESFAKHFHDKYGDEHDLLPVWMVTELMALGELLTFFRGIPTGMKQAIGAKFGVSDRVFESWLRALLAVRNVCAHHSRLWNRELGYKPTIPRKDRQWHQPVEIRDNRVFAILTILKYFMNSIAPQSNWPGRLIELLEEYPDVPRAPMGFADNWRECPIWKV